MSKIALFGGAAAIGNSIAAALRGNQQADRVVGRSREALQRDFGSDPQAEIVTWNLDDPASVISAAQGIDTIIYLVRVPYDHFELHPRLMRKTLDGAIAAGVPRILLIGTVYPYGLAQTNPVRKDHPPIRTLSRAGCASSRKTSCSPPTLRARFTARCCACQTSTAPG